MTQPVQRALNWSHKLKDHQVKLMVMSSARAWQVALSVWAVFFVFLWIYCIGHSLLTAEQWLPRLSFQWSVSHAIAVVVFLLLPGWCLNMSGWRRFATLLVVALLASQLMFSLSGLVLGNQGLLHDYVSIAVYLIVNSMSAFFWQGKRPPETIELDMGRRTKIVPLERVVAIKGARNYLEVTVQGESAAGLLRETLQAFSARFPEYFVRIHRSYLINPLFVIGVQRGARKALQVELSNGLVLTVSSRYQADFWQVADSVPALAVLSQHAGTSQVLQDNMESEQ